MWNLIVLVPDHCLSFYFVAIYIKLPGSETIKLYSCSTQLSMKFFQLINVKMPTAVGILTFINMKNSIQDLSQPGKYLIS